MIQILEEEGLQPIMVDASLLQTYMEINATGTIVLAGNVPPSNIFAGENDGSLLETWIAGGGTCIIPGDWLFYYYSTESGRVTLGSSGERRILNTTSSIISTSNKVVSPTTAGRTLLPSLGSYTGYRTVNLNRVPESLRVRTFGLSGTYADPVQIYLGEGSIFYGFTYQIDVSDAQNDKIPEVFSEFILNKSKSFEFNASIEIIEVSSFDFDSDTNMDYLCVNISNTGNDMGSILGAYVNDIEWDIQRSTLVPGDNKLIPISTASSAVSSGSLVNLTILFDFDSDWQSDFEVTHIETITSTTPDLAVYYDETYVSNWIIDPKTISELTISGLISAGYTPALVDASALKNFMTLKADGTVVMILDNFPRTVWNGQDNSFVEQWFGNGGKIIQIGDWPFYYIGEEGGGRSGVGSNGARRVFNASLITTSSFTSDPNTPFSGSWQSIRPVSIDALNTAGYTYYSFANNTDETLSDPTLFQVGSGWYFYLMNCYRYSSMNLQAALNIIAAVQIMDALIGL